MGHMGDFPYDAQYGKRAKFDDFSPLVESVFLAMEGEPFTKFLEDLTGIDPVLSDPDRFGAGMHSTIRGGFPCLFLTVADGINLLPVLVCLDHPLGLLPRPYRPVWSCEPDYEVYLWQPDIAVAMSVM